MPHRLAQTFSPDARIAIFPCGTLLVRDAYIGGEGLLVATLWGLVPLANSRGVAETARAELMFADGALTVTMRFAFDRAGLIESVRSESRAAMVGKDIVMMPWEGPFSHSREHKGVVVPFAGEAAWLSGQGRKPYWRGEIGELNYEFNGPLKSSLLPAALATPP